MKTLTLRKIGIFCACLFFSAWAFADTTSTPTSSGGPDFFVFVKRLLIDDLQPLLATATTVSYFIGLCLIIAGITRLHHHGSGAQNMMQRTSPMGTAMFFIAGAILVSFMPYLHILSNSIFGDAQSVFSQSCNGQSPNELLQSSFRTNSNDFCPMLAYSQNVNPDRENAIGDAIKYLMFGVLFLVGIISFIRGMVQLVRLGEGGQGQGVGRALTHIFAGLIAVNADAVYNLIDSIFMNNTAS